MQVSLTLTPSFALSLSQEYYEVSVTGILREAYKPSGDFEDKLFANAPVNQKLSIEEQFQHPYFNLSRLCHLNPKATLFLEVTSLEQDLNQFIRNSNNVQRFIIHEGKCYLCPVHFSLIDLTIFK